MDRPVPHVPTVETSASIFLILRRMRTPLIVLILIFAVSVLGLTLMPGEDGAGRPHHLGLFDAFYVMSYTATTIGFGELPHAFTPAQRLWVTLTIYLSVIGWAYAIGALLSLSRDRGFRRALAVQRFVRSVRRLREPFFLVVGHGAAGQRLTRALDAVGLPFVVLDTEERQVTALDVGAYHSDAPALVGSARDPRLLGAAGLTHPQCDTVLAMTGDDEANLAVAMTASLLRPDVRVVARSSSRAMAERMLAFGEPDVVDPFDRFGDHLRILLRSPAAYRLMMWLTSPVGSPVLDRRDPLPRGRWVVYGQGDFGHEIAHDLRAEGLEVVVVGPTGADRDGYDVDQVLAADLPGAVGLVAATANDTTNLSVIETAQDIGGELFTVTRQNATGNAVLYRAIGVDFVLVPAEVVLHETLARLVDPLLMPFLREVPHQDPAWTEELLARVLRLCGRDLPDLWHLRLDEEDAPALTARLDEGLTVGDLLRDTHSTASVLPAVPLLLRRGEALTLAPEDGEALHRGDEVLFVGRTLARRSLAVLADDPGAVEYLLTGRTVPSSWVWRRLARR